MYMYQLPHTAYVRIYTSMCRCAVTTEDGVSTFFSCGKTKFSSSSSSSCPDTKSLLFPRYQEESAVSVDTVSGKNRKRLVVGGERPQHPLSPVLTVLIVVNQRCGQFPLQLYGLMCQTSNSSQQLLIAGHRQGHVATGGSTSAIRQHCQLVQGSCSASPLSLP